MRTVTQKKDHFKEKKSEVCKELNLAKKKNARLTAQLEKQDLANKALKAELKALKEASPPAILAKELVRQLAVVLRLDCGLSLGQVQRVLEEMHKLMPLAITPTKVTVGNWVEIETLTRSLCLKLPPNPHGYVYMIDASIVMSDRKIMVILAVPVDHYLKTGRAPRREDAYCLAVGCQKSWNGESIAKLLKEVIDVHGLPVGIVKDGGCDLKRALSLLNGLPISQANVTASQRALALGKGIRIHEIDDLGHYIANLLKKKYGKRAEFPKWQSTLGKCSTAFKQSELGSLTPPKSRHKGRFMAIEQDVRWSMKALALSPVGRATTGSCLEKFRDYLGELQKFKPLLSRMEKDLKVINAIQKELKNNGLTKESKSTCERLLATLDDDCPIKSGMKEWLKRHFKIQQHIFRDFDPSPEKRPGLLNSSDILESTFGRAKALYATTMKDPDRIACLLPGLCGPKEEVFTPEQRIKTKDLKTLRAALPSLQRDRIRTMEGQQSLEDLRAGTRNLSIIAGSDIKVDGQVIIPRRLPAPETSGCLRMAGAEDCGISVETDAGDCGISVETDAEDCGISVETDAEDCGITVDTDAGDCGLRVDAVGNPSEPLTMQDDKAKAASPQNDALMPPAKLPDTDSGSDSNLSRSPLGYPNLQQIAPEKRQSVDDLTIYIKNPNQRTKDLWGEIPTAV